MFTVLHEDPESRARVGELHTKHGVVKTPAYVIVATNAEIRTLRPDDIPKTKTQIVIVNTYHLWRAIGEEKLNNFCGVHDAMGWSGVIMTDSGGFQVFSLGFLRDTGARYKRAEGEPWVKITESGVYFRDTIYGGEELYLDAERSIKIQEKLGGDSIVAFDEATAPTASFDYTAQATSRTHAWAERSLAAHKSTQLLYGVVQGGMFKELREKSAKIIGAMAFDGFALGSTYGDAYGGTKEKTKAMLACSIPYLPRSKPRHLFGVGQVRDIFEGVKQGIDTFDCVIPTREARHGTLWTARERFDITKGKYGGDRALIEKNCTCPICFEMKVTRGELRALFKTKNLDAGRFATIHNVCFFNTLMERVRVAIHDGGLATLEREYRV